jgi:hypothetical protein
MATLPDLTSFDHWQAETNGRTLTLPIRGNEYTWRAGELSMWAVLKMRHVQQVTAQVQADLAAGREVDKQRVILTDEEDARLTNDLLGDQREKMLVDGVRAAEWGHIVRTLINWHLSGEKAARVYWARVQGEEAPADPPACAASTKTAGSSKTTRRTTGSRGTRSSNTGRSSKPTSRGSTK